MRRLAFPLFVAGLLGYPICILVYWWLTPAYGVMSPAAILGTVVGASSRLAIGNAFALASCLLAIPATLGYMAALGDASPRLSVVGGVMSIVGWVAVFGILVLDIVAITMVASGPPSPDYSHLFTAISTSPTMIALNAAAALHIVGGVLLGVAFWRTKLVPRWAAVILIVGGPIHFTSNISGILSIDSLTWVALVAANVPVIRRLRERAAANAPA